MWAKHLRSSAFPVELLPVMLLSPILLTDLQSGSAAAGGSGSSGAGGGSGGGGGSGAGGTPSTSGPGGGPQHLTYTSYILKQTPQVWEANA